MKIRVIKLLTSLSLIISFGIALRYSEGLTSHFVGQYSGFQIDHQHTGWGTSLYYPTIDPKVTVTKPVKIAVIDSGLDQTQLSEFNVVHTENFSDSEHIDDTIGHGTKIASIIAAKDNHQLTVGLSPSSELAIYKVVNDNKTITLDNIERAIRKASQDGVHLINLSLVTKELSPTLETTVTDYLSSGGMVVVPAYDLKAVDTFNPLARIPGVISVASYNEFFSIPKIDKAIAYYAPYSQEALSLKNQIVKVEGTSYSTAFVTGTIANLMSQGQSQEDIRKNLDDYFSLPSVQSKQPWLAKHYEQDPSLVENAYVVLLIVLASSFLATILFGLLAMSQTPSARKEYTYQLAYLLLLIPLLFLLLLPGM